MLGVPLQSHGRRDLRRPNGWQFPRSQAPAPPVLASSPYLRGHDSSGLRKRGRNPACGEAEGLGLIQHQQSQPSSFLASLLSNYGLSCPCGSNALHLSFKFGDASWPRHRFVVAGVFVPRASLVLPGPPLLLMFCVCVCAFLRRYYLVPNKNQQHPVFFRRSAVLHCRNHPQDVRCWAHVTCRQHARCPANILY